MTATRRQTRWTPDEDSRLRELAARGLSATRIGEALSTPDRVRTRGGVIGRACTLKIPLTGSDTRWRPSRPRRDDPGLDSVASAKKAGEPAPIGKPETLGQGCSFIAGDFAPGWRCCGHPRAPGSAYCAHHHARVFTGRKAWTREAPKAAPNRLQAELARLRAEARQ